MDESSPKEKVWVECPMCRQDDAQVLFTRDDYEAPDSRPNMETRSLHINDQSDWRGGERQVFYLVKGLKERGHEVELVSQPSSVIGERAQAAGIKVHPVRMRGEADIFAARRIAGLVRSREFDVVHMHTAHAHMLGCMACARNSNPVCIVSRRVDFPIRKRFLGLSRIKYVFRVDRYIAISNAVKEVLIKGGVKPEKISVVYSGVESSGADGAGPDIRAEFGLSDSEKIVGTVGALVGHKGHRYLIEAAPIILEKHPHVKFIFVGDGELRSELKALASQFGVQHAIIFAGYRSDVHALLRQFDVYAAPSHMEGLNTSILDALMAKRPVVAARAGGIPEIVEHDKTGLLVPPGDHVLLAEAVVEMLTDKEKALKLALAGCKSVQGRFTADKMVEGTISVYEDLLKDRGKT